MDPNQQRTASPPPEPSRIPPREEPTPESSWPPSTASSSPESPIPKLGGLFGQALAHAKLDPTLEDEPPQRYAADPDCPQCGGHGYLSRPVPLGHADFGKAFPCPCSEAMYREQRIRRLFGRAQIPPEFQDRSFATYALRSDADHSAARMVRTWTESGEGSLYLWGEVGHGKTGLALCALRHRIEVQGVDALYRYVPDLFAEIRRGFDREVGGLTSDAIELAFRESGLLLLDDVGKERRTDWVIEEFNRLINHRWQQHKPTIFTSNYPLESLKTRMGEAGEAFYSRVRAMCWPNVLEVRGHDLREGT